MKGRTILVFLFVVCFAAALPAQTKISGTANCGKPDPLHSLDVGDRPGHTFSISQTKCSWSKPLEIAGTKSGDYTPTAFAEASGNGTRDHGYVAGVHDNGDKFFCRYSGKTTLKDGKPVSAEGTWSYTGGTGKLKGIKGGGTFKGTAGADGSITYEVEGDYTLPEPKAKMKMKM